MKKELQRLTLSEISEAIEREEKLSCKLLEETAHKDYASDSHAREVSRLKSLFLFVEEFGSDCVEYGGGYIVLMEKIYIAAITGKWKIKGRSKFYYSPKGGPEAFRKYL